METLYQSLVSVNPVTLIAQICNLFITLFVFKHFFWKKLMNILDQRREAADKEITDAQAARSEAMEIKATYEQNMLESKAEADKLIRSAQQTATVRSEEIIRDAQRTAVAIKQKAEADIAQQKKKAVNDAKDEISSLAMDIAGKVVGATLDSAHQERLVDNFLKELGEQV